jgi:hypothetical protein
LILLLLIRPSSAGRVDKLFSTPQEAVHKIAKRGNRLSPGYADSYAGPVG